LPDLTAPPDLEDELPDFIAPLDLEVRDEELLPERTAPPDLVLEVPDLTAFDLFCELPDLLLTAFDLFCDPLDLLLTALLEELLFELLRVAAGFEEEDFAFVACDLLWLLLELFTCRELLFEDERLDT